MVAQSIKWETTVGKEKISFDLGAIRNHKRRYRSLLFKQLNYEARPGQSDIVITVEEEKNIDLNPYVLLFRFFLDRNALQGANERLLKLLSDVVKQAASTEETINKQLEDLIQETSQNEEQLTQWPLESGTLHESQFPTDSIRRPEGSIFPGLLTSTPAAGPSAPTVNFATPAGGERTLW